MNLQELDRAESPTLGPARLVSVNVGMPRDVSWQGRTVRTAAWKQPVTGPHVVRSTNIDGDGQGDLAGHGGPHRAVLVYQLDSYAHWRRTLDREDLVPGNFGENFTVDGLPDDEVRIGDRFAVSDALFEVSQPRVTCYRVGLRLGEPRLAALLVAHRRPGFYLRVLREGRVQAGDDIIRVATDPDALTVAAVDGLLYLPGHDRADVARALRSPALSPGWRASFEAILVGTPETVGNPGLAPTAPPAWPGFRSLCVLERRDESGAVVSLRLGSPDGTPLPPALPGQYVTLRLPTGADGVAVTRSYSLSGGPGPTYRISVKKEPGGTGSTAVHGLAADGPAIDVAAPRGTFTLGSGQGPVLLVSAGIGVTPVLAMLHALAVSRSSRRVVWMHGARNGSEHPFAAEVAELLSRLPNSVAHTAFSSPLPGDRLGIDYQSRGRLPGTALTYLGPTDLGPGSDADAYVCGPPAFMAELREALVTAGTDPSRVHEETFGPGPALTPGVVAGATATPHPPAGTHGTGPTVTFARSNLTVRWRANDPSLLDLAEACDVPVRWSCRTGVCHSCEAGLLDGDVAYEPQPIDLPATGSVLVCCAVPTRDVVLDL